MRHRAAASRARRYVSAAVLEVPRPAVVVVLARELVVEGSEASIRLVGAGRGCLHRAHDPSSAAKGFIHFLGLGGIAQVLLQPGPADRRQPRVGRRGGSGGDRARLAPSRQLPPAGAAVRLAAPDRAQRGRASRRAAGRRRSSSTSPRPPPMDRTDDSDALDDRLLFRAILGTLSQADRELARLRYFEDLTCAKLADQFGLSEATVKVRLHRLRRKLRQRLEAQT